MQVPDNEVRPNASGMSLNNTQPSAPNGNGPTIRIGAQHLPPKGTDTLVSQQLYVHQNAHAHFQTQQQLIIPNAPMQVPTHMAMPGMVIGGPPPPVVIAPPNTTVAPNIMPPPIAMQHQFLPQGSMQPLWIPQPQPNPQPTRSNVQAPTNMVVYMQPPQQPALQPFGPHGQ